MPRGSARSIKTKFMGGRVVSAKSKTGDPQCSSAMSAWQNIRHGNPAGMALEAAMSILGKCRSKARALKQAGQHRTAGNEARAQHLEHRAASGGPVSAKDRLAKARELRAGRQGKAGGTEAWKQGPDQYQASKGVHQPWIAEISPHQYARMGKHQQAAYDKKRAAEWDASAGAKREWQQKVMEAHQAGKITRDTPGIHAEARRSIIHAEGMAKKLAKEAKRKLADDRRVIRSPSELKPGQAIETTMYGKGTVSKVNRSTVVFKNKQGEIRLPLKEGGPAYARRMETPGRAAEVVAKARELRAARASAAPAQPSLREQAASHRAKQYGGLGPEVRQSTAEILRDQRKGKATYHVSYAGGGYGSKAKREDIGASIMAETKAKVAGVLGKAREVKAPAKPSLREQAAAHRAKKGTAQERAKAIVTRLNKKYVGADKSEAKLGKELDAATKARNSIESRGEDASRLRAREQQIIAKAQKYTKTKNRLKSHKPTIDRVVRAAMAQR